MLNRRPRREWDCPERGREADISEADVGTGSIHLPRSAAPTGRSGAPNDCLLLLGSLVLLICGGGDVARGDGRGGAYVVVTFDLMDSNLPLMRSFPQFLARSMQWLRGE
jgi:hypothetical protein